jgi:2',3'-cyclic-nucleotide 2'-phosphodiesterase (5'-nucleotidase family)
MHKRTALAHGVGLAVVVSSVALAACQGCRTTAAPNRGTSGSGAASDAPTLRVYLVSDLAGALEPCGCTKDQLGGLDHAAAWMRAQKSVAPDAILVSAGPLFFMDESLKSDHRDQDVAKAETIATSLKSLGLAAFAPGANEWAAGGAELSKLRASSGAPMLIANATAKGAGDDAGAVPDVSTYEGWTLVTVNGLRVGILGVTAADKADGASLPLSTTPPPSAILRGIDALKKSGAQVFIALAAVGRGEAKRLADAVPSLTAIVVGSPGGSGDVNAPAPPPERIGDVLLLQTGNHLTTVGALDLFVREGVAKGEEKGDSKGSVTFADGTGLELAQKRDELQRRVDDLRNRISAWERDPQIRKDDLAARRAEVAKLEGDLAALSARPSPPTGSFFRYESQEIRDKLGSDAEVKNASLAFFKQVNDHNRVAFADRLPPPATPGHPSFIGVEACSTKCHADARAVWDGTRHSHAYATLVDQNKQFNLDCVSCHVTGYDQPGGSSVTHVDRLMSVQCENCHGPGSMHAADPKHVKPLVPKPSKDTCVSCHHSPHVEHFDVDKSMTEILGPGHGL